MVSCDGVMWLVVMMLVVFGSSGEVEMVVCRER